MWFQITQVFDRQFFQCECQGIPVIVFPGKSIGLKFVFPAKNVHENDQQVEYRTVQYTCFFRPRPVKQALLLNKRRKLSMA